MKILIVSNLYPPYYVGGYELRCALTAEGLKQAGYDVRVLTSRYGLSLTPNLKRETSEVPVDRALGQYVLGDQVAIGWPYFLNAVKPQIDDAKHFNRVLDEFQPDVVNWWSIRGLSKAILSIPKLRGIPDILCVDDDWIVEEESRGLRHERPPWSDLWQEEGKPWYWRPVLFWLMNYWKSRLCKQGIETGNETFRPRHGCFVSKYLRDEFLRAGVEFSSVSVVYGGVRPDRFFFDRGESFGDPGVVRLLYAGQLTRDRGLHTAINAVRLLTPEVLKNTALTVVGDTTDSAYLNEMQTFVQDYGLSQKVRFAGKTDYQDMPEVYRSHDILVAPSLRKEGLPFTMMEAMLSGCAVVTTGSGGAIEIARLANLPLFPKGDEQALSNILESLIRNRQDIDAIARRGQHVALTEFSTDRMIERFLNVLQRWFTDKQECKYSDLKEHVLTGTNTNARL